MFTFKQILEGDVIPFPKKKLPQVEVLYKNRGMHGQYHYTVRNKENNKVYHFIKPHGSEIFGTHVGEQHISDDQAKEIHRAILFHYNDRGFY